MFGYLHLFENKTLSLGNMIIFLSYLILSFLAIISSLLLSYLISQSLPLFSSLLFPSPLSHAIRTATALHVIRQKQEEISRAMETTGISSHPYRIRSWGHVWNGSV